VIIHHYSRNFTLVSLPTIQQELQESEWLKPLRWFKSIKLFLATLKSRATALKVKSQHQKLKKLMRLKKNGLKKVNVACLSGRTHIQK
jgi:hypothetical protein